MRQVQCGRQSQFVAQLVGCQDLGDRQNFGSIGFEIGQRHRAVAGTEVNPETEAILHGIWRPDIRGVQIMGPVVLRPSRGLHFTSTSAGAIAGIPSATPRSNCGSFTISVFQPRWTSTPEKGADPAIRPTSRYSSAEYPAGTCTVDPSCSMRTGLILKYSCRTALHPV